MDKKISAEEKLEEIVWCDHVYVQPQPLVTSPVPHVYIPVHKHAIYLVIEELKVKIVCQSCWLVSTMPTFKES